MQNNFGPTGDVSLLAPFSSILVSYTKDVLKEEKGKIISFSQYGEDVLVYVMQTLKNLGVEFTIHEEPKKLITKLENEFNQIINNKN